MATVIPREELEKRVKELQELLRLMPDDAWVCERCHTFYDKASRDYCWCDYESEDYTKE